MPTARKTHLVTIAALLVAVGIWYRGRISPQQPLTPQDAIYRMLDAARAGNVAAYLASYTGGLQASLQQSIRESSEAAFVQYLKDSNAAIKGIAVGEPQPLSDTQVSVRLEYVYQDRNEAQTMQLEKSGGQWKIARVDSAERVKTLVPYGTPVK